MSIHPFARKCDQVIAHLREILAGLKKAKEKTPKEPKGPQGRAGSLADGRVIWLLGSPQMENQAAVFGSERGLNTNFDKAQPKKPAAIKGRDRGESALQNKLAQARYYCELKRYKANEKYFRCRKTRGQTAESCKPLYQSISCPDVQAAERELSAYHAAKYAERNSGGGAGGGF